MRYYDFTCDMKIPGRWVLADPVDAQGEEVDPWQFCEGQELSLSYTLHIAQAHRGRALDFSLSTLALPIVHARVVPIFERLGLQRQVQFLPVQVEGRADPYYILNALRVIRCIDEARCEEVVHWLPEDNRPDKTGQYRNVVGLRIDTSRLEGTHILRPWGWHVVLIASEQLKQALEQEGITGMRFVEV